MTFNYRVTSSVVHGEDGYKGVVYIDIPQEQLTVKHGYYFMDDKLGPNWGYKGPFTPDGYRSDWDFTEPFESLDDAEQAGIELKANIEDRLAKVVDLIRSHPLPDPVTETKSI